MWGGVEDACARWWMCARRWMEKNVMRRDGAARRGAVVREGGASAMSASWTGARYGRPVSRETAGGLTGDARCARSCVGYQGWSGATRCRLQGLHRSWLRAEDVRARRDDDRELEGVSSLSRWDDARGEGAERAMIGA